MSEGCSIEGCVKTGRIKRGWCDTHYARWRRTGSPILAHCYPPGSTCIVDGCHGEIRSRWMCTKHYARWQKRGSTNLPPRPAPTWNAIHTRLRSMWGPAKRFPCISCGAQAHQWAYDGTDPQQMLGNALGSRNRKGRPTMSWWSPWPEFYMPMCLKCHAQRDGATVRQELREYREWKLVNPGKSLSELTSA